mmetsp:Transcript_19644/g.46188  ORF Transcript_19644/g.46188 Transcript_19644/m.46188 type:complete len:263 (+) Transcript_19644:567-1355(+)
MAKAPHGEEICVQIDLRTNPGKGTKGGVLNLEQRLNRCFPPFVVELAQGVLIAQPSRYWYEEDRGGATGVYCMGIFKNQNQQLVLGASVLQDTLVTIDREKKQVRFSPHRCAAKTAKKTDLKRGSSRTSGLSASVNKSNSCVPEPAPLPPPLPAAARPRPSTNSRPKVAGAQVVPPPPGWFEGLGWPRWPEWLSFNLPGGVLWGVYALVVIVSVCALCMAAAHIFGCSAPGGVVAYCCEGLDDTTSDFGSIASDSEPSSDQE